MEGGNRRQAKPLFQGYIAVASFLRRTHPGPFDGVPLVSKGLPQDGSALSAIQASDSQKTLGDHLVVTAERPFKFELQTENSLPLHRASKKLRSEEQTSSRIRFVCHCLRCSRMGPSRISGICSFTVLGIKKPLCQLPWGRDFFLRCFCFISGRIRQMSVGGVKIERPEIEDILNKSFCMIHDGRGLIHAATRFLGVNVFSEPAFEAIRFLFHGVSFPKR